MFIYKRAVKDDVPIILDSNIIIQYDEDGHFVSAVTGDKLRDCLSNTYYSIDGNTGEIAAMIGATVRGDEAGVYYIEILQAGDCYHFSKYTHSQIYDMLYMLIRHLCADKNKYTIIYESPIKYNTLLDRALLNNSFTVSEDKYIRLPKVDFEVFYN